MFRTEFNSSPNFTLCFVLWIPVSKLFGVSPLVRIVTVLCSGLGRVSHAGMHGHIKDRWCKLSIHLFGPLLFSQSWFFSSHLFSSCRFDQLQMGGIFLDVHIFFSQSLCFLLLCLVWSMFLEAPVGSDNIRRWWKEAKLFTWFKTLNYETLPL